jgi:pSer/pThr/pTyr-binding forkhead associated (FHA) protein
MKVQLIVVQGKPEGKIIPLAGPVFRIGRGEKCQLRPTSEQVSREHAEFKIGPDQVIITDLGSRNGTFINGKELTEPHVLNDRDLVGIGPLTFAVSIQGAPATAGKTARLAPTKERFLDEISHDEIESWLVADHANPTPDHPLGVKGGDTITLNALKAGASKPAAPAAPAASKPVAAAASDEPVTHFAFDDLEIEPLPEGMGDPEPAEDLPDANEPLDAPTQEFLDESNPFHVKPKAPEAPAKVTKKEASAAADDILRRLMEHRRPR